MQLHSYSIDLISIFTTAATAEEYHAETIPTGGGYYDEALDWNSILVLFRLQYSSFYFYAIEKRHANLLATTNSINNALIVGYDGGREGIKSFRTFLSSSDELPECIPPMHAVIMESD